MEKILKTSWRKVTWYNQDGNFTSKEKVEDTDLKLTQFTQSREATAIFTLLINLMLPGMN